MKTISPHNAAETLAGTGFERTAHRLLASIEITGETRPKPVYEISPPKGGYFIGYGQRRKTGGISIC